MGQTALQSLQLCMALAHGMGVHSQMPCSDAVRLPSCTARLQEERRLRREAKRRWAMQRLYFARWRAEARRWVPYQRRTCFQLHFGMHAQSAGHVAPNPIAPNPPFNYVWPRERRRIEERARQERLAANLKACRVGGAPARKVGMMVGKSAPRLLFAFPA